MKTEWMRVEATRKGHALDLGKLYAYSGDDGRLAFWWRGSGRNTTFRTGAEVREFFAEALAELEAEAERSKP